MCNTVFEVNAARFNVSLIQHQEDNKDPVNYLEVEAFIGNKTKLLCRKHLKTMDYGPCIMG